MDLQIPFLSGRTGTSTGIAGDQSELVIDQLHGKYHNLTKLGRVFSMSNTPLGNLIPIYTATAIGAVAGSGTVAMPLWNPTGSGVKLTLLQYKMARASGTAAVFSVGLMGRNGMGGVIATGSQITAFAETTPVNGLGGQINGVGGSGGGFASKAKSSRAGSTIISAGVAAEWLETLGGTGVEADLTANGISLVDVDFDGRWAIYPGTMVWLGATLGSVALYCHTLSWSEEPL